MAQDLFDITQDRPQHHQLTGSRLLADSAGGIAGKEENLPHEIGADFARQNAGHDIECGQIGVAAALNEARFK